MLYLAKKQKQQQMNFTVELWTSGETAEEHSPWQLGDVKATNTMWLYFKIKLLRVVKKAGKVWVLPWR